jgi:hypothetical protein
VNSERKAWLRSEEAGLQRRKFAALASEQARILCEKGMQSTDPIIRMHAASFATWTAALKELEPPNESD